MLKPAFTPEAKESSSELHYAKLCEQAKKRLASVQGMVQILAPHFNDAFTTKLSTITIPHFCHGSNSYVAPFEMSKHLVIIDNQLATVERMLRPLVDIANASAERIGQIIEDIKRKLGFELVRIATPGLNKQSRDAADKKIQGYKDQIGKEGSRLGRVQHQKETLPAEVKKCEATITEAETQIAIALQALEKPIQELQVIYDRVIEGHAEVASMTITGKIVIALPVIPDTLLTAEGMKKEAGERQKATRAFLQTYITKKQARNSHSFDSQEWRDAISTAERTLPLLMTSLEGKQNEHADDLQILSATSKKLASTEAPSAKLLSLMIDEEILRRFSSVEEKHEEPVVRRFLLKKNRPDAEIVDVGDDGLTDVEERAQQIDRESIINNAIASVQQLYMRIGYTDVQALVYAQNDIEFLQHLDDQRRTSILNDFAVNPNREEAIQAMQTYLQGLSLVVDSHEEAIGIAQCAESVRALIAERQVEVDEVVKDKVQPTPESECTLPYSRAEWTGNYPQFIEASRKEAGRLLRLISKNAEQLLARILVAMIIIKDSIQKLEDVKKQTGAVVVVDISKSVKATGKDATDDLLKITSHTVVLHLSALWNAKFFAHHEIDSEGNSVLKHIRESRSLSVFKEDQRRYLISKLDEGSISQSDAQELYREYERQCIEYITKMIHYFGLKDQEARVISALKKRIEGEAEEHLEIIRSETKKRGIANGFYQYVQGEEVDILNQCIFSLVACRLLEEIEE